MVELKGTKTEANLKAAFAGESQAHTKYEYYASQAKKDGYVQISNIFSETSHNEKEHAKIWFKLLHGGRIQHPILKMRQKVKIMNGQVCIRLLQKKLEKKDLMK